MMSFIMKLLTQGPPFLRTAKGGALILPGSDRIWLKKSESETTRETNGDGTGQ